MAHIDTHNDQPGIRELFAYRPDTAKPLQLLAQTLLRGASPLEPHERELIAAAVSRENDCTFFVTPHTRPPPMPSSTTPATRERHLPVNATWARNSKRCCRLRGPSHAAARP